MKKKTAIIVGAGVATAAVAGYLVYRNQQKKKSASTSSQVNNGGAAFMSVSQGGGAVSLPSANQIADAAANAQRQIQTVIPEVKQIISNTLPVTNSTGASQAPVYTPDVVYAPSFSTANYSLASLRAMKWYGGPNKDVYVSDRIANYDPSTGTVSHTDPTWKGTLVSDTQINWKRIDGLTESWVSKSTPAYSAPTASSQSYVDYGAKSEFDYALSGLVRR